MENEVKPEKNIIEEIKKDKLQITDLPPYAKKDCKQCLGRGYLKMVNADGSFKSNEFCKCVWKSKKRKELMERITKSFSDNPVYADPIGASEQPKINE